MPFNSRNQTEHSNKLRMRRLWIEKLEARALLSATTFSAGETDQSSSTAFVSGASISPAISAPATFTATPQSGTQVNFSWSAVSDAVGYKLYQFVSGAPQLVTVYSAGNTQATLTGLTPNTTYAFNLVAFSLTQSAATPWISVTTLGSFAAPTNFSGTALSGSQISLTWGPSSGASGYRLYQVTNGIPNLIQSLAAGSTSTTVNGLAPNTTYTFNLQAFTSTQTATTPNISVTTTGGTTTLTAPTNFAGAALSNTQIGLTWTAATGATGYRLYQAVGGTPTLIATLAASATSTTVSNLFPATTYSFNLVAFNSSQTAATPWISVATTGSTGALTPPTNFAGTALSSTQISLTWTAATGQTGYNLFQIVNGVATQIATYSATTTSATINNLTPSTAYQFNLVAFNATTTSATPWITVSTGGQVSAPTNFTGAALSATQVSLSWSAAAGATGYRLYQFIGGQPTLIATFGSTTTTTTVSSLTPNTTYAFNLVAFNGSSTAATPWISVATTGLAAPGNFTATPLSNTQIGLSWTASPGATGYRLYQIINGQVVQIQSLAATATSATVSGLNPNTTYSFNLVAFNSTQSAATAWVSATTTTANLQPPAIFTGAPLSSTQVTLSWSAVAGATGFRLYQFINGAPSLIATFGASTTSTIVNNLSPNTQYAFNLVAFNAAQTAATPWIGVSTTV